MMHDVLNSLGRGEGTLAASLRSLSRVQRLLVDMCFSRDNISHDEPRIIYRLEMR